MNRIVYIDNDNILRVTGLADSISAAYMNAATVTVTLYESDGVTEVTGQSWPQTMAYEAGSNGNYRITLFDTLVLTHNRKYLAIVEADNGTNEKGHWEILVRAQTRKTD